MRIKYLTMLQDATDKNDTFSSFFKLKIKTLTCKFWTVHRTLLSTKKPE